MAPGYGMDMFQCVPPFDKILDPGLRSVYPASLPQLTNRERKCPDKIGTPVLVSWAGHFQC